MRNRDLLRHYHESVNPGRNQLASLTAKTGSRRVADVLATRWQLTTGTNCERM